MLCVAKSHNLALKKGEGAVFKSIRLRFFAIFAIGIRASTISVSAHTQSPSTGLCLSYHPIQESACTVFEWRANDGINEGVNDGVIEGVNDLDAALKQVDTAPLAF